MNKDDDNSTVKVTIGNNEVSLIEKFALRDFTVEIHNSIKSITDNWDEFVPSSLFFSSSFLSLIEDHPPKGLKQMYLLFYKGDHELEGVSVIQIKKIDLGESMKFNESGGLFAGLSNTMKKALTKAIRFDTLICGNVLLTGEYGYYFKNGMAFDEQLELIEGALNETTDRLGKHGYNIKPILMKDFYARDIGDEGVLKRRSFTAFRVQPNMIMDLKPEWLDFRDYLADLKSKYRVRVKRAFKKGAAIDKKELKIEDIKKYNEKIYQLYMETAQVAGFNLFVLPKDYFIHLKEYLQDDVKIVGYFLNDELIGYYTIVYNNSDYMEAHYLGYDKTKNAELQMYLNMLYDLIKEGIACRAPKIQFARTALEIKSSVGAQPYETYCLLSHRYKWLNAMLPLFLKWYVPVEEWLPRTPFKN